MGPMLTREASTMVYRLPLLREHDAVLIHLVEQGEAPFLEPCGGNRLHGHISTAGRLKGPY